MNSIETKREIGELIKSARLSANLTQKNLASSIQISRRCLIGLESGSSDAKLSLLLAISEVTDTPIIKLIPKAYIK